MKAVELSSKHLYNDFDTSSEGDILNIVNINFSGINAKRENALKGNLSISNNVKLTDLTESKFGNDSAKKTLKVSFDFSTEYKPEFASIMLNGNLLMVVDSDKADEMLSSWEESKKLDMDSTKKVLQAIMNKSLLQTIVVARELDLPAPIKLPVVSDKKASEQ